MSEENISLSVKKSTLWKGATFLFAALFVLVLIVALSGNSGSGKVVDANNQAPTGGNVVVSVNDADAVLGDVDAEISIVEFSDFECPFCARAFFDAVADFKTSSYFKNGEVNLVFKNFPLNSIHPNAQPAAEAAECANLQGKFWEYHDLLFENQQFLDESSLKAYASQIGLDMTKFNTCVDNRETKSKVDNDLAAATKAGGRGTPYFVILNHDTGETVPVSGAVPWANFEAAIKSVQ